MILGLACIRDLRILGADELHAGEAILSDDCVWGSLRLGVLCDPPSK